MIVRRNVLQSDHRVVKWSLVAAAFALSLGSWAERSLASKEQEPTSTATMVEVVEEAPAPVISRAAS